MVGGVCMAGGFRDGKGRAYLMVVNRDLKADASFRIELRRPLASVIRISRADGGESHVAT
jgi:hypothetical protein